MKPFDLSIGPLAGSRSAVRFSVTPWDELHGVHRRVREATAAYRPPGRLAQTAEFRPHVGIGYINRAQRAASLIEDIAILRNLPVVEVHIDAIHLVELRREGRQYRWGRSRSRLPRRLTYRSGAANSRAAGDHFSSSLRYPADAWVGIALRIAPRSWARCHTERIGRSREAVKASIPSCAARSTSRPSSPSNAAAMSSRTSERLHTESDSSTRSWTCCPKSSARR
ncbi:2'-5' RNA ligase family protein [Nocardia sp. CWNU-33]|uniref:2'-5' RNA ligase family protein n=1 Tax=Nocardia sp. CWNU-33 TaxID=3392117 RepID=UPI00398F42B8